MINVIFQNVIHTRKVLKDGRNVVSYGCCRFSVKKSGTVKQKSGTVLSKSGHSNTVNSMKMKPI